MPAAHADPAASAPGLALACAVRRRARALAVAGMAWVALGCASAAAAADAAKPQAAGSPRDLLRIGVQSAAFPFAFDAGPPGKPSYRGYAVDLCLEVAQSWRKRQGRAFNVASDVVWVPVTPRNRIMKLLAGQIDLECGSTSNTAGRRALGIAFSPTYFVSGVGLLLRPELQPHAGSLMALVAHARQTRRVFATTGGSTSEQHLQQLAADVEAQGGERVQVKYATSHEDAYQMITKEPPDAHAFLMDQVLLAAALLTDPRLKQARITQAPWSPVPQAAECYGIMTRSSNGLHLQAGGQDLREVVRETLLELRKPGADGSSRLLQLYQRWFQRPLGPGEVRHGQAPGVNLDFAPSPALSRALVARGGDGHCD